MTCPSPRGWFPNMAVEDSLGSMQPFKKGPLTKLPEKFPNVGTSDWKGNLYIYLYSMYNCFPPSFFLKKGTHTPPLWGCFFFSKKNQPTRLFFFSKECVYIFRKLCFELVMNLPGMTSEDEESPSEMGICQCWYFERSFFPIRGGMPPVSPPPIPLF